MFKYIRQSKSSFSFEEFSRLKPFNRLLPIIAEFIRVPLELPSNTISPELFRTIPNDSPVKTKIISGTFSILGYRYDIFFLSF